MYSGGELGIQRYWMSSEGELNIRTYLSGSLICASVLFGHTRHLKLLSSFTTLYTSRPWASEG